LRFGRKTEEVWADFGGEQQGGIDPDGGSGAQIHTHHGMQRLVQILLLGARTLLTAQRFHWLGRFLRQARQPLERLIDLILAGADLLIEGIVVS
jgi:hypothetical protein